MTFKTAKIGFMYAHQGVFENLKVVRLTQYYYSHLPNYRRSTNSRLIGQILAN